MDHLAQAIMTLAPPYEARADAPSTYAELTSCSGRARLPVWEGASDRTIYQSAAVNHAFRAWHDATHVAIGADFTLEGERRTCEAQIAALYIAFPSAPAIYATFLRVEIVEQALYLAKAGTFPCDQATFVRETMLRKYGYLRKDISRHLCYA